MIKIMEADVEGQNLTCPVIICDSCNYQITKRGNVLWKTQDTTRLYFVHNDGRGCLTTFEKIHGRSRPGDHWYSRSIELFLSQLTTNHKEAALPEWKN